ncbi:MAG: PEGA domain-containing protein [Acidobacteriota bacterium]
MRALLLIFSILSLVPFYAQDLITENKSSVVKLIVDSDPAGAEVYIDGKLYGQTPLSLKDLSPGTHNVQIKKESFNTYSEKVECPALGYKEVFRVLSGKYALLNLESSVTGAQVFMGDSLLGTAPLLNVPIPLGKHTIQAKTKDYLDWTLELNAAPTRYDFKAVLKYMYGYMTLSNSPGGSQIFVDDRKVDPSELNNYRLKMGDHKIEVNHPSFSAPIEENFLVSSEMGSNMKVESGYFSLGAFFKSLLLPGFGQYQDNAKIKGLSIFSGALLSGALWINSEISNSKKLKEYEDARAEYSKPSTVYTTFQNHNKVLSTYDAVKKSNNMKNITMSAFVAVYVYNILDALIFHSTGQRLIIKQEKPSGNSINIGFNWAL